MTTHDFIKQAIGKKVYLTSDGDLGFDGDLRGFIYDKTELTLIRLTKGGRAIVEHNGKEYSVPPRNVMEVGN